MANKTPLYSCHVNAGGKIVDFSGWELPIHYGSQVEEHNIVRNDAGIFDVSHMTIVDIAGEGSKSFLQYLLANDVAKLQLNQALYSAMCNPEGGVIDDLIVYWLGDDRYRLVVNAATHDKDLAWINKQAASYSVKIRERADLAMLAVQGPNAFKRLSTINEHIASALEGLSPFYAVECEDWMIASTGYTGEQGVEIMLPEAQAESLFAQLISAGIVPCGLGARDTLRLEAGMNLYGTDMDEGVTPLQANMGWTVAWEPSARDFIGRQALEAQRHSANDKLVGLILEGKGVLRSGQVVRCDAGTGIITSGTFSPTLKVGIALARVPSDIRDECEVEIRGKYHKAKVVKPCFVRHGKSLVK